MLLKQLNHGIVLIYCFVEVKTTAPFSQGENLAEVGIRVVLCFSSRSMDKYGF
mgnify:CR=1 FL=1